MIELLGTVRLDLAEGLVLLIVGYGLVYFLWVQIAGAALTRRERAHVRTTHEDPDRRRHDLFVLVPCRDEELVVEATTRALLAQDDSSVVVVIDDASTDRTAEIAGTVARESDRVVVLRRRLPDARIGKGAALNAALDVVRSEVARRGLDPHQVVVGVMDADGQLSPGTTDLVGRLFDDDAVGGVQLQVRIRNRQHFLTRVQDIGFWGTSAVAQMGRNQSRSVSLGGNGQFARLAALDSIDGPAWSDSLTEDLDLMISLTVRGWDMRMTSLAHVEQEGPETVRALVRQRTRWAQGHMLCTGRSGEVFRSRKVRQSTALELLLYLWQPWLLALPWSVLAPALLVLAGYAVVEVGVQHGPLAAVGAVIAAYTLAFVPFLWGAWVYSRRSGNYGLLRSYWTHQGAYVLNLVTYVATWRALFRIALGRDSWAKTARVGRARRAATVPRGAQHLGGTTDPSGP